MSLTATDTDTVIMEGPRKLADYIRHREGRFAELEKAAEEMCYSDDGQIVSRDGLYERLYGG